MPPKKRVSKKKRATKKAKSPSPPESESSDETPELLQCIYCNMTGLLEHEAARCSCCTNDEERDVFCRHHIYECSLCFRTGCHGCATVNDCDVCGRNFCEFCIGDGACRDCNRLHYCSGCLEDGLCPECAAHNSDLEIARQDCQNVACVLLVIFDRTTNPLIRRCVPRVLWQQIAQRVWATRYQVELWASIE